MKTYLYHLTFKAPIHFGSHGIGLEETTISLGSDSFCSALVNAFALMGQAEEVIDALNSAGRPDFVLSSLFPYSCAKPRSPVYLVPRPLCRPLFREEADGIRFAKKLKKRRWLEPDEASRWVSGKPLSHEQAAALAEDVEKRHGQWWVEDLRPRVALDRHSSNSSIWWCGTVVFKPHNGLYGLIHVTNEAWKDRLQQALALLGEMGLGGERTYGMGEFEVGDFIPIEQIGGFTGFAESQNQLLLSRYYPSMQERGLLDRHLLAWDMVESRGHIVSGRHATGIKRKRVRMLTEGCVAQRPLTGTMIDVTPDGADELGLDHRVYRCGLGFWIGKGGAA